MEDLVPVDEGIHLSAMAQDIVYRGVLCRVCIM